MARENNRLWRGCWSSVCIWDQRTVLTQTTAWRLLFSCRFLPCLIVLPKSGQNYTSITWNFFSVTLFIVPCWQYAWWLTSSLLIIVAFIVVAYFHNFMQYIMFDQNVVPNFCLTTAKNAHCLITVLIICLFVFVTDANFGGSGKLIYFWWSNF